MADVPRGWVVETGTWGADPPPATWRERMWAARCEAVAAAVAAKRSRRWWGLSILREAYKVWGISRILMWGERKWTTNRATTG